MYNLFEISCDQAKSSHVKPQFGDSKLGPDWPTPSWIYRHHVQESFCHHPLTILNGYIACDYFIVIHIYFNSIIKFTANDHNDGRHASNFIISPTGCHIVHMLLWPKNWHPLEQPPLHLPTFSVQYARQGLTSFAKSVQ